MTKLIDAILDGNIEFAKELISQAENINETEKNGSTALMCAARNGHKDIVEALLKKGADVNIQNESRWSALIYAARNGHTEIVNLLLEKGANIHPQSDNGWTILMYTAENGHKETVNLLLEKGASIHSQSYSGWTALICAAKGGYTEIVNLLLEKEASIHSQTQNGWISSIYTTLRSLITKKTNINAQTEIGCTALMHAAEKGHTDTVKLLLEKKADLNIQDQDGWTALIYAANNGHTEIVRSLLEKKVHLNIQTENRWTALMYAADEGHTEIVKLLTRNGAAIFRQDQNEQSLLAIAANSETKKIIEESIILILIELQTQKQIKHTLSDESKNLLKRPEYQDFIQKEASHTAKLKSRLFLHTLENTPDLAQALAPNSSHPTLKQIYKKVSEMASTEDMGQICARKARMFERKISYKQPPKTDHISPNTENFHNSITNQEKISEILQKATQLLDQNDLSLEDAQFALDFINYDYLETLITATTNTTPPEHPSLKTALTQESQRKVTFLTKLTSPEAASQSHGR